MTVWAKQRKILRAIVLPIPINMFDLNWDPCSTGMAFGPSASRAAFADFGNQVFANEAVTTVSLVVALLESGSTNIKLIGALTKARAILLRSTWNGLSA
jgi:hypothetical protein